LQRGFGESWISSTCLLSFAQPLADAIERSLTNAEIETRRWWGNGAHTHPATVACPRASLPATDTLARSTLAVPFYRDIRVAEINRVAEAVLAAADAGSATAH
jgi:dTDP-4-amino-4,6-dideoxygalactose transaminase